MLDAGTLITLAATAPPALGAAGLYLLDGHRPRRPLVLLAAMAWGVAVAAIAAAPVNDWLLTALVAEAGAPAGHALAARAGAPVVEELLKGVGLLLLLGLRPDALRTARDGALLGAFIGLGFELVENQHYLTLAAVQAGSSGLLRGVWVRGILGGLKHAIFTATTGAGLGWARQTHSLRARLFVPLGAFVAAVLQHAVWNTVASQAITAALCGAPTPEAACRAAPPASALYVGVPLIVAACLTPGVVGLLMVLRRPPHALPPSG
jgi:RsiW-degrading membrane proteinase PrsW (M82 family)